MHDRWAEDDEHGDGGLAPADEPLPLMTEALGLAFNNDIEEPWRRYVRTHAEGGDAIARWEAWFRRFLRRLAEKEKG